jgi:hypothetical protein
MRHTLGTLAAGLLLFAIPVSAQWRNLPTDGVPLGSDGKPNLSAPAPRTSSGKPDLSGIYQPNMQSFRNLAAELGLENVPMTDEARKIHKSRETKGLNGKQWLDHGGLPTSDKLTVIEKFRRPNVGRLEIELTITDPTYYTKPWTVTTNARLMLGTELFEFICNENERSTQHMGPHIK